jgi:hypothetical protein
MSTSLGNKKRGFVCSSIFYVKIVTQQFSCEKKKKELNSSPSVAPPSRAADGMCAVSLWYSIEDPTGGFAWKTGSKKIDDVVPFLQSIKESFLDPKDWPRLVWVSLQEDHAASCIDSCSKGLFTQTAIFVSLCVVQRHATHS